MANQQRWGFGNLGATNGLLSNFKSLQSPNKQYQSLTPQNTAGVLNAPNATSVITKQPIYEPAPTPVLPQNPIKKQVTVDSLGNRSETHYSTPQDTSVQQNQNTQVPQYANVPNGIDSSGSKIYSSGAGVQPIQPGVLNQPNVQTQSSNLQSPTTYKGLIGGVSSLASSPSTSYENQLAVANKYNQALTNSRLNEASAVAGIQSNPIPLSFQQGRSQVLQNQYTQQQAALGSAYQAAAGLVPATTAQQNVQQSGLLGAAGLTPEALRYGGTAGGTLNPLNNIESITQQVLSGQISPAQAKAMGSGIPTWDGALNQALLAKDPNYNEATTQGNFNANLSNTQVGGTASVNAGASVYAKANPQYQNLKNNIIPQIENFGTLLTQGAGGINPFALKYANIGWGEFQTQLSNNQRAAFNATFQQLQKSIAQLAGEGGSQTPTANVLQSGATIDPNMKMSTLKATLDRISQEGQVYLRNQAVLSNEALRQAQGTQSQPVQSSGNIFSDSNFF